MIFLIRHGNPVYGNEFFNEIERVGQDPRRLSIAQDIVSYIEDQEEQFGGRILDTPELWVSAGHIASCIAHGTVNIVTGPRTRHVQSGEILARAFKEYGIQVSSPRVTDDLLTDIRGVGRGGIPRFVFHALKHQKTDSASLFHFGFKCTKMRPYAETWNMRVMSI